MRAAIRLPAIVGVTLFAFIPWMLTRPVGLVSRTWLNRCHRFCIATWARTYAFIMGMSVEAHGTPPSDRFFLVSNHLSYIDIVAIFTQVQGVFIAKAEVARWPLFGAVARTTGTIFLDRGTKADLVRVIDETRRTLDDGLGVIVFPEGTSSKGDGVLPFRPSIFEVPIRTAIPVSYASIRYTTPAGGPPPHEVVAWWGDMTFLKHFVELLTLRRFQATITFGESTLVESDRKLLAQQAQAAVAQTFTPLVPCEA